MVSGYTNFLEQTEVLTLEKYSIPTGFLLYTNTAAVSLFNTPNWLP